MKLTKVLILALMLIALAVFVMQLFRWKGAWIFISLYWGVLTVKNLLDWKGQNYG